VKHLTLERAGTVLLGLAVALLIGGVALATPAADELAKKEEGKPIDVVICLDVSGSMNGLIDSARTKLWDIVNDLAKIKPTPKLRVGLYSYGHTTYDAKKGWVRKEADLTDDLDEISRKLFGLSISGGNEYVARVCRDAIDEQKWSEDKNALKIIFVAGNEPATQDPQVKLKDVADKAVAKGIFINPIYCKSNQFPNYDDWKEFGNMGGGVFALIDQDKGAVTIATPLDKELDKLSREMSNTYLSYGKEGNEKKANQQLQDANASKQSPGAAASRAESKGGGLYRNDAWDLVDRMKNDPKFDVKKVPVEELCEEMKKMTPEEREKHVKEMLAKREALQKQINELSAKRQAYLKEEAKKNVSAADKAFDDAVRGALRKQADSKGIKIPD
jgi:hypothetical protein